MNENIWIFSIFSTNHIESQSFRSIQKVSLKNKSLDLLEIMGYISFLKPSFYGYQMTKLTHKRWLKTFYYGTHFACSKNFKLKNQIFRFKVCTFLKYLDFPQEIITVTDNTFQNHIGHTFITPRCKIMKILKNYRFSLYGSKKWVFSNFEGDKKEKS